MFLKNKKNNGAGFTLIELIIGIAIISGIIFVVNMFSNDVLQSGSSFSLRFESQQEIQIASQEINQEIRSMSPSNLGGYPIENAQNDSFVFYSDIDGDGLIEKIRYFLDGNTLKKGVMKPAGDPLSYEPSDESFKEVLYNIVSAPPVFYYYDSTYIDSGAPLALPVNATNIRMIKFSVSTQKPGETSPFDLLFFAAPRNLKNN